MPLYDYQCPAGHLTEVRCNIAHRPATVECDVCKAPATRLLSVPHMFTTIVPDYPGAKARKAGYVHSHGTNYSATKTSIGPAGFLSPRAEGPAPDSTPDLQPAKVAVPEVPLHRSHPELFHRLGGG